MAEVGLVILTLSATFSLTRVFDNPGFMAPLAAITIVATALSAVMRRRGVPTTSLAAVHLIVGTVFIVNLFFASTTSYGIPTGRTLDAIRVATPTAMAELLTAVPPIEASPGLLIVIGAGLWVLCLFADIAAFRVNARVQAVLPLAVAFLALGFPDSDSGELASVAVFAVGLGCYAVMSQIDRDSSIKWMGGEGAARRGALGMGARTATIAVIGVVATTLAMAVTPVLEPMVSLHTGTRGDSGRELPTPFIGIRSLLSTQSNTTLFSVRSNRSSYWRITALDSYDSERDIWVSTGTYQPVGTRLEKAAATDVATVRLRQRFQIEGLGGPWMPAAFEPVGFNGEMSTTFNAATSTLFAEDDLQSGDEYRVTSELPEFEKGVLRGTRRVSTMPDNDNPLLWTPRASQRESTFLYDATFAYPTVYDELVGLQNKFRSEFAYNESVDYSKSPRPIDQFLLDREGFCQQFSSVFALMARRLGLPSRVAIGFTMGETETGTPPASGRTYTVKGLHAHAWPEVLFPGVGWVPFEPTPGRGNPATTAYTGVAGAQAAPRPEQSTTTTSSTTTTTADSATSAPSTTTPTGVDTDGSDTDGSDADGSNGQRPMMARAAIAISLALVALAVAIHIRRKPHDDDEAESAQDPMNVQIASAWDSAVREFEAFGLRMATNETPIEFADRVATWVSDSPTNQTIDVAIATEVSQLAEIETIRRYSAEFEQNIVHNDPATVSLGEEAAKLSETIRDQLKLLNSTEQRVS